MNSRLKFLLPASLAAAALACAACGGARELQTADTAALVSAPAQLLAPEAPAPKAASRAFTPVVAVGDGLELAEESIAEKNDERKYEIDLAFPQLKGRLSPRAKKFNRAVRALVAREARELRNAYAGPPRSPQAGRAPFEDVYESLTGDYEFIHFADDLVSVRLTLYGQGRGAANPIQFNRVLNFDLKSGRALKLDDLFRPGAQHLRALAAYCVADLKRQDEEDHRRAVAHATSKGRPPDAAGVRTPDSWFQSGAGPEVENYRAWNLTAEGVVVAFASCQVMSCADGEKEVLVPYAALDAVLNQSGPAARLFARQPR